MTRMERRRRRQWAVCIAIVILAVAAWITALLVIKPWHKEEVTRTPVNPPYQPVKVIKAQIEARVDHPEAPKPPEYDVPLDKYQQQILWEACKEWNVPYELALAVCFCETEYKDLVTVITAADGTVRHYYGMMAVQLESAGSYMEKCNVEYLNSERDRLRVGCCILGEHIANYGITRGLMCYNMGQDTAESQWTVGVEQTAYTIAVLNKMEELMG